MQNGHDSIQRFQRTEISPFKVSNTMNEESRRSLRRGTSVGEKDVGLHSSSNTLCRLLGFIHLTVVCSQPCQNS